MHIYSDGEKMPLNKPRFEIHDGEVRLVGVFDCDGLTQLETQIANIKGMLQGSLIDAGGPKLPTFDLIAHLIRQRAFSARTFGPGPRTAGVIDHIRKELKEIEARPSDLSEWIDVVLLGFDGAWRAGYAPESIARALDAKQTKNEGRNWPDWRTADPNKGIEHDRTTEEPSGQSETAVLSVDGDCACALLGDNLHVGEAEFVKIVPEPGETFDKACLKAGALALKRLRERLTKPDLGWTWMSGHPAGDSR